MNHHQLTIRPYDLMTRRRLRIGRTVHTLAERFVIVPIGAVIALVWANTAPDSYFTMTQTVSFYVNEIAMALFFALITQEVMEAMMPGGALHSSRHRALPLIAAAGGIAGSVAIYFAQIHLSKDAVLSPAWPVACAIDVVATYYVLKAILPRSAALPFALLLAIATDLFGLIAVAPNHLILEAHVGGATLVMFALGLAAVMRAQKVRAFWPYLFVCGTMMWIAFYWEGLHPAFALVPIVPFLPREPRSLDLFKDPEIDDEVHYAEHEWFVVVQCIVFAFALVNAGVVLRDYETGSWAMITSALIGRPAGVLAAVGLASLFGFHLPGRMTWRELVVMAFATSSGFTIGLFFAAGMIAMGPTLAQAKIGILISTVGALIAVGCAYALKVGRFRVVSEPQ